MKQVASRRLNYTSHVPSLRAEILYLPKKKKKNKLLHLRGILTCSAYIRVYIVNVRPGCLAVFYTDASLSNFLSSMIR
jgi:hypothetical protein